MRAPIQLADDAMHELVELPRVLTVGVGQLVKIPAALAITREERPAGLVRWGRLLGLREVPPLAQ